MTPKTLLAALVALALLAAPAAARPFEVPEEARLEKTFVADTYSFQAMLGALIDQVFQCFDPHTQGLDDNTVLFDGATELLDIYNDGTQPFIFEFETTSDDPDVNQEVEIIAQSPTGTDLFPEGFQDPGTGTPLTDACVEIGIDDTLDSDPPAEIRSAQLQFVSNGDVLFDESVPSQAFTSPWNGRLSLVLPGFAGQGINQIRLVIKTEGQPIFADGFESGDTASWTRQVP